MILTNENYYSPEANRAYYSVSQIKSFMDCPARTMAELNGEFQRDETTALLVGSYVDAHFSRELDLFRAKHPELYTRTGTLRSEFKQAEEIIARLERDELAMAMMAGDRQRIVTGEIGGLPFKAKLDVLLSKEQCQQIVDSYNMPDLLFCQGAIVDLKIVRDFKPLYKDGEGRLSFIEYWKYTLQLAVYQELMRQETGNKLPCFILAATKEPVTDIGLFAIPQLMMDTEMEIMQELLPGFDEVKTGADEPGRCELCSYCKNTKKLTHASTFVEWGLI